MLSRQAHLDFFGSYDLPVVNITVECCCRDFVAPAKAHGLPPFAVLLHSIARTSLALEPFRHRLFNGHLQRVDRLRVSYPVDGADGNLNFSTFVFDVTFAEFLSRYLTDRGEARQARHLRLAPMEDRDYLFVTCLPWLAFTAIQHPVARFADCSIPNVAVGRFRRTKGEVTFPLAIQAHHGLVDGWHIQQFIVTLADFLDHTVEMIHDV